MAADKFKVTVTIPRRDTFHGYWAAQRFFATGVNRVEVTAEEKKAIEADQARGLPIAIADGWPKDEPKK